MLIGDVFYYRDENGKLDRDFDRLVPEHYAGPASRGYRGIVVWMCRNGNPRDVRVFRRGRQLTDEQVRQWQQRHRSP